MVLDAELIQDGLRHAHKKAANIWTLPKTTAPHRILPNYIYFLWYTSVEFSSRRPSSQVKKTFDFDYYVFIEDQTFIIAKILIFM
jgi:hypothetical protein